ncbi:MAG: M81 family metallopeptidase [Clostridia bacterium]|nr:M81 family metallopeptidase [Clostridia bacterium]
MQNKKVFVCGLREESNSFNPLLCDMQSFKGFKYVEGESVVANNGECCVNVDGMLKVLLGAKVNVVGNSDSVYIRSGSGGPLDSKVVDWFIEKTINGLKRELPLDGVVLSLHGATTSDKSDDVCGDILQAVRQTVGEQTIISVSFDLHANVTEKVMQNADYVSGYHTYPHLDIYQTGERAAQILVDHFNKGRMYVARVEVPLIAPASAYTTNDGKLGELMGQADAMVNNGTIVDYSIFQVQPWLDVEKMSSTVLITTYNEEQAKTIASEFAFKLFNIREDLQGSNLYYIQEVIDKALANKTGKPVVLVDSADSPNAGACSDSAVVLEYLLPYKDQLKCALSVTDVKAVDKAFELGVGGIGDFTLGASIAPKLYKPVSVKNAKVIGLYNGDFIMAGPQEKGQKRNIGKTAVLQVGKILIHICYHGKTEGDVNYYKTFGIDPVKCDLVCVKACTSFRAGYQSFSAEICNTDTPGAASPSLKNLPYEKRPKPLYPFEEITENDISIAKIYRK